MAMAERTIEIARPPEDLFDFVADGLNGPRWRAGVLDGVRGPGGRRVAADYEVTEFEPARRLAFTAIAGPIRPTGEYRLERTEAGCRLTFGLRADLGGWQRLVMSGAVQRTMDGEMMALDRLKTVIESQPAPGNQVS
jgi:uncharacterized protein YndB with AHSA1/START domain